MFSSTRGRLGGDPDGGHGRADRALHRAVAGESRFERESGEGLRSRLQGAGQEEEGRRGAVEGRHRAAFGVPGAARGAGHVRRPCGAPGTRRRRQGRDDPARDEWRQPRGRAGRELQGPIRARARSGLPTPLPGTAAVAGRDRHLQPVPLRGSAGRPCASREPRAPEAPGRDARAPRLETQVRSDQRLGDAPLPQRLSDREDIPQPLEGRAARPLPEAHRPPRAPLEVLVPRCGGAPVLGRLPGGVLGDVESHQHRVGALVCDPGRPQVVCAHRGRRRDRQRADRHRPALPDAR